MLERASSVKIAREDVVEQELMPETELAPGEALDAASTNTPTKRLARTAALFVWCQVLG